MSLECIKRISIREFLINKGIKPHWENSRSGMYFSPLRNEKTPSFKVNYIQNL